MLNIENNLKINPDPGDTARAIGPKYVEHMQRPFKALARVTASVMLVSIMDKERGIEIIKEDPGTHFDRRVVRAFLEAVN